jgi:hypothetical protein
LPGLGGTKLNAACGLDCAVAISALSPNNFDQTLTRVLYPGRASYTSLLA